MTTVAPGLTASPLPSFTSQISSPESCFFHSFESSGGRGGVFLSSPAANGARANAAVRASTDNVLMATLLLKSRQNGARAEPPGQLRAAGGRDPRRGQFQPYQPIRVQPVG